MRPYFLALVPTPSWQYAPVSLLTPIPVPDPPSSGLSVGAIVGISIAAVTVAASLISAVVFLVYRHNLKKKVEKGEIDPEEWEAQERGWK